MTLKERTKRFMATNPSEEEILDFWDKYCVKDKRSIEEILNESCQ